MCSSRACIHGTRNPVVAEPKIYHFGSRRRQCSQCKRTWRIRKKRRGRKPQRARPRSDASSVYGRTHTENSRSTLWPYPSRVELAVSSISAAVHIAISGIALAKRTFGFALGRTLFPISRERLGFDVMALKRAIKIAPSFSILCSSQAERTCGVGLTHSQPSPLYTQTDPGFGLRRDFRNYRLGTNHGWMCTLPFSSHQPMQQCRGRRNRRCMDRPCARRFTNMIRQALDCRMDARLQAVLKKLRQGFGKQNACASYA